MEELDIDTSKLGTRAKRWINAKQSTCLPSGKLRPEVKQRKIDLGWSKSGIDLWEAKFTSELEELKRLDEIEPEPWVNYTAYDFFTEEEKIKFNPDGTLREEFIYSAREKGLNMSALLTLEQRKINEVEQYNKVSACDAEMGINHGQWLMDCRRSAASNYAKNYKQQQQDLRNGEEISSLPLDIDPDEYYK